MTLTADDIPSTAESAGRPQGKSERWDRDAILLLALLTLADADAVSAAWNALAPSAFRGLLLATAIDDVREVPSATLPPLWFDVFSQRYGISRRGFITMPAVFDAVEQAKQRAAQKRAVEVAAVFAGSVDIGDWQAGMVPTLKTLALMARALGRGGVGRLTGDDLKAASTDLVFHFTRLERFARQIERGVVVEPESAKRAGNYAVAVITGGFDSGRVASHVSAGFSEERNVLAPAEHCASTAFTDGCVDVTAAGWVKIGTLPLPGTRTCRFQCKCHIEFRRVP